VAVTAVTAVTVPASAASAAQAEVEAGEEVTRAEKQAKPGCRWPGQGGRSRAGATTAPRRRHRRKLLAPFTLSAEGVRALEKPAEMQRSFCSVLDASAPSRKNDEMIQSTPFPCSLPISSSRTTNQQISRLVGSPLSSPRPLQVHGRLGPVLPGAGGRGAYPILRRLGVVPARIIRGRSPGEREPRARRAAPPHLGVEVEIKSSHHGGANTRAMVERRGTSRAKAYIACVAPLCCEATLTPFRCPLGCGGGRETSPAHEESKRTNSLSIPASNSPQNN